MPRISFTNIRESRHRHSLFIRGLFVKKISGIRSSNRGQTLVETAAALGVASVIVAALIAMGIAGMRATTFSKNRTMANLIANEALEAMRAKKNASTDFEGDFPDGACFQMNEAGPRFILSVTVGCGSGSNKIFRQYQQGAVLTGHWYLIEVNDATQNGVAGKLVTVTVRFTDSGGNHDSTVETFFTSWK